MSKIWIQPTGAALAADVHSVDLSQPLDEFLVCGIAEELGDALGDARPDFVYIL